MMAALEGGGGFQAVLHSLSAADGSATYVAPDGQLQIVVGVNYPVEVPYRSDEIPESTLIEVNLRPHNSVGMVKERHVEQLIQRTLQAIVLGRETPRTKLQITLQVLNIESDETLPGGIKDGGQSESYLHTLASSINASILGCLDAGVQMKTVAGAALVGVTANGQVTLNPAVVQRKACSSLHVFAFTSDGHTILVESEGRFTLEDWNAVEKVARTAVLAQAGALGGNINTQNPAMPKNGTAVNNGGSVIDVMRKAMEVRVIKDEGWRAI